MKKLLIYIFFIFYFLLLSSFVLVAQSSKKTAVTSSDKSSVADEFVQSQEESKRQHSDDSLEEHLYKKIQQTYINRNITLFNMWSSLFRNSFANSIYLKKIDQMKQSFFYQEKLDRSLLVKSSIKLEDIQATSWEELATKFIQLKKGGITTIRVPILQRYHFKLFSFLPTSKAGYFLHIPGFPLSQDILDRILSIAHSVGLQVYASLPLRNHILTTTFARKFRDSSWNPLSETYNINNKVDLYHTNINDFFKPILNALSQHNIDGFVLESDFGYEPQEGFSEMAKYRFLLATGEDIRQQAGIRVVFSKKKLRTYFVKPKRGEQFIVTMDSKFFNVAEWRAKELKQFLWNFIVLFRKYIPDKPVGLEVIPSMVHTEKARIRWATGVKYFWDLKVDFFHLIWRKQEQDRIPSNTEYIAAAQELRRISLKNQKITLSVILSKNTQNVIILNRLLNQMHSILKAVNPKKQSLTAKTVVDKWINHKKKTQTQQELQHQRIPMFEMDSLSSRRHINIEQLTTNK